MSPFTNILSRQDSKSFLFEDQVANTLAVSWKKCLLCQKCGTKRCDIVHTSDSEMQLKIDRSTLKITNCYTGMAV